MEANPMTNLDMRAFVRVVEHRSFAAAAKALGLTSSAVSKLVSRLEDRLGVCLLHRTTRRLALTSEGEVYFTRARRILAEIDDAEIEISRMRGAPSGRLRVNTSTGFGVHQLAPALPELLARYPEITVELSITDRVVDLVADHADVTIRAGRITDTALAARKIADFQRIVCAAPSYLERHGVPQLPADLASHPCIVVSHHGQSRWPFRTDNGVIYAEVVPRVMTDSAEVAVRLAVEGAGIARLGEGIIDKPIRDGRLLPLLTAFHHSDSIPLSALYLAGRHRLPKVRVFLNFLVERFGSAPWRLEPHCSVERTCALR
jgi:DNA-binding transcriptional LysR family regulator